MKAANCGRLWNRSAGGQSFVEAVCTIAKSDEKGQRQKGFGADAESDERKRYARDTTFRPLNRNFENQNNTRSMVKLDTFIPRK